MTEDAAFKIFDETASQVEAKLHGDVQICSDKNHEGKIFVDVQEIWDEDEDEYMEEAIDNLGWVTIESMVFNTHEEATKWLIWKYL
ncbi:hypothetical protein [Salmonella phage SSBI34]|nr:hypothetical protein [Salmonella phage SSBI34]